ncbi:MAG: polysaccharide biosynthesis C-terminal domain-containing protein [Lachnospiraceae bacterium]|nr:polysaccharide biosynthesis C-terminal domain-containing protein [Lachnospiraceae bacterium]
MKENKTLFQNITTLVFLTVGLKLIGFFSRAVLAYYYGTSGSTDVFYTASGFIDSISSILLSGLTVGVVNIYISNEKEPRNKFLSELLSLVVLETALIAITCCIFAIPISRLLMPEQSFGSGDMLIRMLRFLSLAFPLQGIIALLSAVLHAEKRFTPVKIVGTINSVSNIIFAVLLSARVGIKALMLSYVAGAFLNSCFLLISAKKDISLRISGIRFGPEMRRMVAMVAPLTIGMAAHQINLIVDKSIASTVTVGAISALSYAGFIYLFFENVIIQNVSTALFPEIVTDLHRVHDAEIVNRKIRITLLATLYILCPITTLAVTHGDTVIRLLYMRGNFGRESLNLTAGALAGYVFGLPMLAIRDISNRVFYAYEDTKTPVKVGVISVMVNITLDLILSRCFGIMGIALATSIANGVSALLMAVLLRKHNKSIYAKKTVTEVIWLIIISSTLILSGSILKGSISVLKNICFCTCLMLGAEAIVCIVMKSEVREIVKIFIKHPQWRD